jgi:predicted Zn-ribbon and HTH transcriptional regulator
MLMKQVKLTVFGFRCTRCGHEWVPREEREPRVCPKCKSPYWNRPRQARAKK